MGILWLFALFWMTRCAVGFSSSNLAVGCAASGVKVQYKDSAFGGSGYIKPSGTDWEKCKLTDPGNTGVWRTTCLVGEYARDPATGNTFSFQLLMTAIRNLITVGDTMVNISCTLSDDGIGSLGTVRETFSVDGGLSDLTPVGFTDSGRYADLIIKNSKNEQIPTTTKISLGDIVGIHVQLSLASPYKTLTVLSCTAADSTSVLDDGFGIEFYDGCFNAGSEPVIFGVNQGKHSTILGFQAFKTKPNADSLVIECEVDLCIDQNCPKYAASKSCVKRKRRALVSTPDPVMTGNMTKYKVTSQVLHFRDVNIDAEQGKSHDDDDVERCMVPIVAVAVVSALLLISCVVVAVLIRGVLRKNTRPEFESSNDPRPATHPAHAGQLPRLQVGKY